MSSCAFAASILLAFALCLYMSISVYCNMVIYWSVDGLQRANVQDDCAVGPVTGDD